MQPSAVLWHGSVRPVTPCFIISAYLLIPRSWSRSPMRFMFPIFILFHVPCPEPCSVLLRITSPCSIFVPMFFCPNPCPFPFTLLCSFRYLYVNSSLYVPQSEIDIDCPLWTSVRLIRTFRIHWNLRSSKLRTREHREAKHQSLSRVLVEPYCWLSSLVVPESFGLPCSVSVCLWLVLVFNKHTRWWSVNCSCQMSWMSV